ncbi:hypothetical protein J6590_013303 [Homalodisca vitripennis]|nr:hypothetical protein J6590_013303 [Homalodisca vitripennis]
MVCGCARLALLVREARGSTIEYIMLGVRVIQGYPDPVNRLDHSSSLLRVPPCLHSHGLPTAPCVIVTVVSRLGLARADTRVLPQLISRFRKGKDPVSVSQEYSNTGPRSVMTEYLRFRKAEKCGLEKQKNAVCVSQEDSNTGPVPVTTEYLRYEEGELRCMFLKKIPTPSLYQERYGVCISRRFQHQACASNDGVSALQRGRDTVYVSQEDSNTAPVPVTTEYLRYEEGEMRCMYLKKIPTPGLRTPHDMMIRPSVAEKCETGCDNKLVITGGIGSTPRGARMWKRQFQHCYSSLPGVWDTRSWKL